MSHSPFSEDWINQFSDPYAILGMSVAADDRRALKRYRAIAKLLHPDSHVWSDVESQELAGQLFARLVNPAYQRLKQDKGRAETLAMLRFRVRRLSQDEPLSPRFERSIELLKTPIPQVETFYEQAITVLAERQYEPLDRFEAATQEMAELNLVYLRLKMGEPMIRERKVGLVPSQPHVQPRIVDLPSERSSTPEVSYAERHYLRAQEYLKKGNCQMAIQELRDAIRIESDQAKYYALIARAYMMQNLPGAAKAYCRQALKLDPSDRLAQACAKRLQLTIPPAETANGKGAAHPDTKRKPPPKSDTKKGKGLFGLFAKRR
ncbi:MAG: DnaJ domain-containing protein [Synechococcales bacterium]|nr:DnaJ domain-containing protein [Synechococcales bacterium]